MRVNNVTFVINTYPSKERDAQLLNTLKSIYSQTYKDFTILLVENYKDKKKIDAFLLRHYPKKKNIKVISDPKKKLSYLFDIGWRSATAEFIVYVADDVVLEKEWLANALLELSKSKKIGIVTGPILSACFPAGEMHRLYLASQKNIIFKALIWPYLHFAMEDKPLLPGKLFESGAYSLGAAVPDAINFKRQEIDLATTSSMLIRRELLEKLNGFDQRFNFNHADGDLFIRTKALNYKILFDPKVISHHYMRIGLSRNAYMIGLDTGIYYRKHIRPKSLSGFTGMILNILVLNTYWIYNALRTRDIMQLKGITGFAKGVFLN